MEKDKGEDPGAGPASGSVRVRFPKGRFSRGWNALQPRDCRRGSGRWAPSCVRVQSRVRFASLAPLLTRNQNSDLIISAAIFIRPINEDRYSFNRDFCQKIFRMHIFFTSIYQNRLFRILTLSFLISIIFSYTMNLSM